MDHFEQSKFSNDLLHAKMLQNTLVEELGNLQN